MMEHSTRRPTINTEAIPQELRQGNHWVTWKGTKLPCSVPTGKVIDAHDPANQGTWKVTKQPCSVATGEVANAHDPKNWGTFEQARQAAERRHHAGIGYVFTKDDPYTGIDLDDCIGGDGTITPEAMEVITAMGTYAEVSPSGTGVKLWVKGTIPASVTPTPFGTGKIEMYPHSRYFTVTGQHLEGTPTTINDAQAALDALYAVLRPDPAPTPTPRPMPVGTPSTDRVRQWCLGALEGERAKMMAATDGEKHARRLASARALSGLVHTGGLTETEIFDTLAVNFGPNQRNAEKTIMDGIAAGMKAPRELPDLDPTPNWHIEGKSDIGDVVTITRAEYEQMRQRIAELEDRQKWERAVVAIPNDHLSPAAKLTALTLWPEFAWRNTQGITEPAPLSVEDRARFVGMSPDTTGKKLKELAQIGAIDRDVRRNPMSGNRQVFIGQGNFFDPTNWVPVETRNHGGTRRPVPTCPTCPTNTPVLETVVTTATYTCGGCGESLAEHDRHRHEQWWYPDPQNIDGPWVSEPTGGANLQNDVSSNTSVFTTIPTDDGWGDTPHSSEITPSGIQVVPPMSPTYPQEILPLGTSQPAKDAINPLPVQPTPTVVYVAPWKGTQRQHQTVADLRR